MNRIFEDPFTIVKVNLFLRLIGHVLGGLFANAVKDQQLVNHADDGCYDHCGSDNFIRFGIPQALRFSAILNASTLPLDFFFLVVSFIPQRAEFVKNKFSQVLLFGAVPIASLALLVI
jgi:hypothetical protein